MSRLKSVLSRRLALAALLLLATTALAETPIARNTQDGIIPPADPAARAAQNGIQREGTALVDVVGRFKMTGDRAVFVTSGGVQYGGLENLTLERVANLVSEQPDELDWIVSGTVTEFRGGSYLLMSKAILKSKALVTPNTGKRRKPTKPLGSPGSPSRM